MQSMELGRIFDSLISVIQEAAKNGTLKDLVPPSFQKTEAHQPLHCTLVQDALRTEPDTQQYIEAMKRLSNIRAMRLLHVAMGLSTEAGEFIDALKKHIFYNKPLDPINLIEELGDTSWYMRVGCDALEVQFLDMLERNVAKLKARYPDKFTEEAAKNRDLNKERETLDPTSFAATINKHYFRRSDIVDDELCAICGKINAHSIHIIPSPQQAIACSRFLGMFSRPCVNCGSPFADHTPEAPR